ncbi:MAG: DUF3419 family protein [bacterium]|nr:DUF3419 family protein [bacterium]
MKEEQKISYSQCWEDPDLVKKGLDLSSQDNLIIITSGGDNVLNLSLIQPNKIIAIDNNSLQNYLLELKIATIKALDYESCISFLGLKNDEKRWEKYLNLRKVLTPRAADFWDWHKNQIGQGIMHCGRFEKFVKVFRNFLIPISHGRSAINKLFSFDRIDEQKDFYNQRWQNKRWKLIFFLFFSQNIFGKFGRSKKMFDYCAVEKVGGCFLERLNYFFEKKLAKGNYFVRYLFTGEYLPSSLPAYLIRDNFIKLKSAVDSIKIVNDNIINYVDNLDKNTIYKFCLSDIFENYSKEETQTFFNKLIDHSRAGSRVCFWNNLVDRYPEGNNQLVYLKDISEKLHEQDRLFFYKKFFVYERK